MKLSWWRVIGLVYVCVLFSLPLTTLEAKTVVRTGEHVSLGDQQEVEGNFYALANSLTVSGNISGDLHAVAGTITLNGQVNKDVFFVGGTVALHASTSEDVRIIAGEVTLAKPIGGSVAVYGGRVNILSTAVIAGDVLVYGGDVTIDGVVGGQVLGRVGNLRINGPVAKGVDIVAKSLTLGERADVTGDVRYQSSVELVRAPGSIVTGEVIPVAPSTVKGQASAFKIIAIFFLILLFTTLALFLLAKKAIERFSYFALTKPLLNSLMGLIGIVILPVVAMVLCATIIGGLLGFLTIGIILVGLVLSFPLGVVVIGSLLSKQLFNSGAVNILSISVGALAISLMLLVPYIGVLLVLAVVVVMFGAILMSLFNFLRSGKLYQA